MTPEAGLGILERWMILAPVSGSLNSSGMDASAAREVSGGIRQAPMASQVKTRRGRVGFFIGFMCKDRFNTEARGGPIMRRPTGCAQSYRQSLESHGQRFVLQSEGT